jgi:hypothetical protein
MNIKILIIILYLIFINQKNTLMKKYLLILISSLFFISNVAIGQDLNEVVDKYLKASGIDKLKDINTMVITGKAMQMGMEFPIVMKMKRPNKFHSEVEIQGMKITQAYDGQDGWAVIPMMGTTDPQDMTDDQIKSFKQMADFEGDLYNWKEKGFQLSMEGKEDHEGSEVYKLKLVKPDGDEYLYYIDADYYILLQTDSKVKVQGATVESSVKFSNYKAVNGLMLFHKMDTEMNNQTVMQMEVVSYEFNKDIDDSIFTRPSL